MSWYLVCILDATQWKVSWWSCKYVTINYIRLYHIIYIYILQTFVTLEKIAIEAIVSIGLQLLWTTLKLQFHLRQSFGHLQRHVSNRGIQTGAKRHLFGYRIGPKPVSLCFAMFHCVSLRFTMVHYGSLCCTCATSFCPSHLGCRFVKWDLKSFTTSAKLPQRHTFKAQNESELALCWSLEFELDIQ